MRHLEIPQLCILTLEPEELEEDENSNEDADIADDNIPNMGLMGVLGKVGPEFNAKVRIMSPATSIKGGWGHFREKQVRLRGDG